MTTDGIRISGVVVLFNPSTTVFSNIESYCRQVETLYAVDNSEHRDQEAFRLIKTISNLVYVNNGLNIGIAAALNRGAQRALNDGFDWLLTMDQDTVLPANYVRDLLGQVKERTDMPGIIAPAYDRVTPNAPANEEILFTMTSANLLNLNAYNKAGRFNEELFIDHVDHEYGLRLNRNNFKVIQVNSLVLKHEPGNRAHTGGPMKIKHVKHSPLRNYYFVRNGFYVAGEYRKDYPGFRGFFLKQLFKNIIKIIFFERDFEKLKMSWKGYNDYRRRILGKLK